MASYIRISDGRRADASEACAADGSIRPGYRSNFVQPGDYIGFDMAFLDKRSGVVKDGEVVRVPMMLRDGANATFLTDAERTFADSAEGAEAIAFAKSVHGMGPGRSQPWNDALQAEATRNALAAKQSSAATSAALMADAPRLAALEEEAFQRHLDTMNRRGS